MRLAPLDSNWSATFRELLTVVLGTGGIAGFLWKVVLPFVKKRYFSTPGPGLALSSKNTNKDSDFPRRLSIENIGNEVALGIAWEIRDYYDPFVPPRYELRRGKHPTPLKPGETFVIKVGEQSRDRAMLCDFEIFLRYSGSNHSRFYSHLRVDYGDLDKNDPGLNRAQFALIPFLVWARHFWINTRIQMRVKMRPTLHRWQAWRNKHQGGQI
jgi:hypothetical protein